MAKHPAARRVHREHNEEDVFVSSVLETSVWARHHGRILAIGGGLLVAAVAIFAYVRHFNAQAEDRASTELTIVRQEALSGNTQLAARDLSAFVQKYGKTPSGDEARLMLAQMYLQSAQPAKAIETIKPLASNPGKGNGASAALIMAAGYEDSKQLDRAEQTYLSVADKARFGFEKREALDRAAMLRMSRGNTAGAAELYERALKTLPANDEQRTVYEMRIAEVRAAGAKTGS
ncbi:MAG TPA: tetratricopeptide repeat protein [Longimicrobiales bacterium]